MPGSGPSEGGNSDGTTPPRAGTGGSADPASGVFGRRPAVAVAVVVVGVGTVRFVEVLLGRAWPTGVLAWSTTLAALAGGVLVRSHASDAGAGIPSQRTAGRALLVGGFAVALVQLLAHALQAVAVAVGGSDPVVAVEGLNPVTNAPTGVGRYLLVGVCLTAVGEELLFRGAALRAFGRRVGLHRANVVQAGLFGLWHLAWPLTLAVGPAEPPIPLPVLALGTVLVTGLVGAVFGVLARVTGTLWTPVLAHLIHNVVAVFVHVRGAGGDRSAVLSPVLVLGYATLAWLVWRRYEGSLFAVDDGALFDP